MMMPNASPTMWSAFKTKFAVYKCRSPWDVQFAAKQHITINNGHDDMHYDFIMYVKGACAASDQIKETVRQWIDKAGGRRDLSYVKAIWNRSKSNLESISNYCWKFYPTNHPKLTEWMLTHPLPSTQFQVPWITKCKGSNLGFWGRAPMKVQEHRIYNGVEEVVDKDLSPMEQVWRQCRGTGGGIPRYETAFYRYEKTQEKLDETVTKDTPVEA